MSIAREILDEAGDDPVLAEKIAKKASSFSDMVGCVAPAIKPYPYQKDVIDDWRSPLIHWSKPRQVGASHTFGVKGDGLGIAVPGARVLYLSLSLEDAREKIDYAVMCHEALAEKVKGVPRIVTRSVSSLKLSNGSRLNAVFYPRGKARAYLFLDEFAHHPQARKMYRASMPILILGGQLIMASTVLSGSTLFSEIGAGADNKYSGYRRITTDWWECPAHCRDLKAAQAGYPRRGVLPAKDMATRERVYTYGSTALINVYEGMPEEDFRCEFERVEIGDDLSWLSWELIRASCPTGKRSIRNIGIKELEHALARWPRARAFAGYDVGRRKDSGELSVLLWGAPSNFSRQGWLPDEEDVDDEFGTAYRDDDYDDDDPVPLSADEIIAREVMTMRFDREPFDVQEKALRDILALPRTHVTIDETGMGMQMAERLIRTFGPWRVNAVNFASEMDMPFRRRIKKAPAKMAMAITLKEAMQSGEVEFQVDPARQFQMHSIRRRVTDAANLVLVVDSAEDSVGFGEFGHHHGDAFWSRAMATHGLKLWECRPALDIASVGDDDEEDEDDA